MRKVQISLDTVDKVVSFVNMVTKFDCDLNIISRRYVINAKSIMGILSVDLSKPLSLCIYASEEEAEDVMETLKTYFAL